MNRINKITEDLYYTVDCLKTLGEILDSGDCNDCTLKGTCEYVPKPGELVRYNCPFYKKKRPKWIWEQGDASFKTKSQWRCSECGYTPERWWAYDQSYHPLKRAELYWCPHCGADMRGGEDV